MIEGSKINGRCPYYTEDREAVEAIRKKTREGQPYGEEGFVVRLEKKLGMKIRRGQRGRPRKAK